MKILILHHFYAQPGGEDAVVLAEEAALRQRGHEVRLLARRSQDLALGGALAALSARSNPVARREFSRALDEFKPDVVHAHNLLPGWGLGVLSELIRRRQPAVQTQHNFRWLCAKATLLRDGADCRLCAGGSFAPAVQHACYRDSRLLSAAYGWALGASRKQRLAERAFQRFICVSDFVAGVLKESGFGGERLRVKGHFVPEAPGPLGDGDGSAIYVGRLAEEKGFDVLAQALLAQPALRLKVVGEGPARARWEEALGARVQWLGRLERPALLEALRRSSACVVPSIGTETFGLAALEAMACGLPVVATDAGGLPELVEQGKTGVVVPKGDAVALGAALSTLLADHAVCRRLGQQGLEKAREHYLSGPNLARLEAIYAEAMEQA